MSSRLKVRGHTRSDEFVGHYDLGGNIVPSKLRVLSHMVAETLRISFPTVWDGITNNVSMPQCTARLDSWSKSVLAEVGVEIEVEGREHLDPKEVYVIMSNHASIYDVPALFVGLNIPIRMIGKKEIFRVPIWGQAMRASGFIEVDRGNRDRAIESLRRAKDFMQREHISVWIAPEGTRSPTGVMGPFKQGGFHMALDTGLRILPVSVVGTRDVLNTTVRGVRLGTKVQIKIHAPIDPKKYGHENRRELIADVRAAIASGLPESLRS